MSMSRTEWIVWQGHLWAIPLAVPSSLSSGGIALSEQQAMERPDLVVRLLVQEAVRLLPPQKVCPTSNIFTHPLYQVLVTYADQLRVHDSEMYLHCLRVLLVTWRFVRILALPRELSVLIRLAALFHDIGKLRLPKVVLDKPSPLTPHEWRDMKLHTVHGARLLLFHPSLRLASRMIYHHHERWDGSGYPTGLGGLAIPLGSRIITIADAFAVMTAGRPYRPARPLASTLAELAGCAGSQFDPLLVALFSQVGQAALLAGCNGHEESV